MKKKIKGKGTGRFQTKKPNKSNVPREDIPYNGTYDSIEYCQQELRLAREIFSNRNVTKKQFDGMLKGLGILTLYCPKEVKVIAEATLAEAVRRRVYYLPLWGGYSDE